MMSGLFDRYPNLNLVLGHRELVHMLPRLNIVSIVSVSAAAVACMEKPLIRYLQNNFIVTTSDHFNTHSPE